MLIYKIATASSLAILSLGAYAQSNTEDTSLTPIIVTGQRDNVSGSVTSLDSDSTTCSSTPIKNIPQSVQVLPRKLLEEQDSHTLADALVNVSGIVPSQAAENGLVANIVRGFPAELYLDGLPMYAMSAANSPASLVGIEQISVVKGPSSALYGGGIGSPLGGLINIQTELPKAERSGYMALRTGSYGTVNPNFDFTGAISDTVDARFAGEYVHSRSWIDQVNNEKWSLKPSILAKMDSRTKLIVQTEFNHSSQLEYSGLPAEQALSGQLNRYAFPGAPVGQQRTAFDSQLATVQWLREFNNDTALSVSARYYRNSIPEYGSFVYPGLYPPDPATPTTYPILPLNMQTSTTEATLDAHILTKVTGWGGRHEFIAGINYDHTNFSSNMRFTGIPVTSDAGVTIIPTATFETCPLDLTVLFTPGGTDGTLAAASDPETLAFIRDRGARAKYITSVCSGSLILGAAGLLTGYKATSHWSVRHVLAEYGAIPTEARVVRDRNRITGAGVTAGLDFGLMMLAELRDQIYAECTQLVSEYDPQLPFHAGSLKTASPSVKKAMEDMLASFSSKAENLALTQRPTHKSAG